MGNPVTRDPDYSVLSEARLVAYVWEGTGELRRGKRVLATVAFAHIEAFASDVEPLLARLAAQAPDLENFLFKLRIEGLEVRSGAARPHAHMKSF